MNPSATLVRLSWLVALLALVAAGSGLLWPGRGEPFSFTTLHEQTVEMYGRGLYRHDTLFAGAGNRGTDAVTLLLGVPLLIASTVLHRRGSARGTLLLTGTLVYFLYVYASYALGAVAYNELFLLYVALFSASLYAFVLAFGSVDLRALGSPRLPRRGLAAFLFASGLVTLIVWSGPVVAALLQGAPPARLDSYAAPVTFALDLATITPATFLAGVLVLRRDPRGYRIALSLLVLEAMLAPLIALQTVSQLSAGVAYTPAQIVGPMMGFVLLALLAVRMLVAILRGVVDPASPTEARGPRDHRYREARG